MYALYILILIPYFLSDFVSNVPRSPFARFYTVLKWLLCAGGGVDGFLSDGATLGGIVPDKLSLSCWQRCVEVAVHAEQQKNKGARWQRAMKCTISPGSIVLGFLKGKQANGHLTLSSF